MDDITTEYRNRSKIKYSKNLFGMVLIAVGAFLVIEHIYMWGSFDFYDIIGHEWLGLLLFIIGCIINLDFNKKKFRVFK